MKTFRIATRKSKLALWQAEHVSALLTELGAATALVPLVSGGDTDMRPIDGTRQVGVFTKRIQQALLDDEADIAVHSLKDLPTEANDRFVLAAVPQRERVEDALVSPNSWTLEQLPQNAKIGTGSRRRAAQLLSLRPDLHIEPIRGNVQTRLSKLEAGEYDAIVLAEAGIIRLELDDLHRATLSLESMLPAPGQGALGIEVRSDDQDSLQAVSQLDDIDTRAAVTAERQLLSSLHGGCLAPIAALAQVKADAEQGEQLTMKSVVLSQDGKERLDQEHVVPFARERWRDSAQQLADHLSMELANRGARELIHDQR